MKKNTRLFLSNQTKEFSPKIADSSASTEIQYDNALSEKIISESDDIIYLYDFNLDSNLYVNKTLDKSLGYIHDEAGTLVNKNLVSLMHPEDVKTYAETIFPKYAKLDSGENIEHDFRLKNNSGQWRWFHAKESIYARDIHGNPEKLFGTIRDITDQKVSSDELNLISEVSRFLNVADTLKEVYPYVCQKLHEVLPGCLIFVSVLELDSSYLELVAHEGIGKKLEKAAELLGFDLMKKKFPIKDMDPADLALYRSGKLHYMEDGIYRLLMSKTPKVICNALAKAFGIAHVYSIGFVHKSIDYGGIIIMSNSHEEVENKKALIETIVSQTAAIICRMRIDEGLRSSEKKFRTLANNLPDIISRFDKELHYRYINPHIEKLTGLKPEFFIGKSINEVLKPIENVSIWNDKVAGVFRTGEPAKYEFDLITAEGRRHFSSRIIPEFNEQGSVVSALNVARDITERKLAEESMRESEARYRKMVQILPDGVIIHTEGKLVFANEAARRIMKADSIDQMIGVSIMDFVHPDFRELVAHRIKNSLQYQSKLNPVEEVFTTYDGKAIQVSVTATPFIYLGKPSMLTVFTDITERKEVIEALRESEERYRNMVNILPDGIIIAANDKIVFANESARRIMNAKSIHQMIGANPIDHIQAHSREGVLEKINNSLIEKKPFDVLEETLITFDGKQIQVSVAETPFMYMGKRSILTLFTDISARKKAEKELESSSDLLRNIIDSSNDAIYVKDLNQRIILCNKAYAWALNKPLEDLFGKTDLENGWELDQVKGDELMGIAGFESEDQAALEGDIVHITNEKLLVKNEIHYFDTLKLPLRDRNGTIVGMFGISRNITERQKVEERISHLNKELEQRVMERTAQLSASNKELESFAYSVSHDLRAPLRAIDGFSQLLNETYFDKLDEQGKNYLQRIRIGAQNMAKLIDDLLNLSRISRSEMNFQTVNLSKIAEDIINNLNENSPQREVYPIIKPGLTAWGDIILLKSAMENLLRNGWKFTCKKQSCTIEFGSTDINGLTVFFVRDDGAGFDMAYVDKLFGPFQRLHNATDFPGTGIGLATVQRIIHRHGGKIWAEGMPDKGATFYFTLPETDRS